MFMSRWMELEAVIRDATPSQRRPGPVIATTRQLQSMNLLTEDPDSAPYVFHAHLEVHDEFEAAPFIAAHGWYRQATSALRNALEVMTHAIRFAVRTDNAGFQSWRSGSADPPKFGNSVDLIGRSPAVAEIDASLGGTGIFGNNPPGVLRALYADVCRYAHSRPGHTNADIWRSNGPVFIGRAFTQFWLDFCDALLMCYVLLKIGYPDLRLPEALEGVADNAGQGWRGMAPATIAAYFQTPR
jgi:hypothetical protein